MDRKTQNADFSQNVCENSEDCIDACDNSSMYNHNVRSACSSAGDIVVPNESLHCNSKNSISISLHSQKSIEHYNDDHDETEVDNLRRVESAQSHMNSLEATKKSSSISKKRPMKTCEVGNKLKAELTKYKKELKEYNNTTKDLEEKYLKINYELNEMQEKHDRFVANRRSTNANDSDSYTETSSSGSGSEYSLKRKYTQIFNRNSSIINVSPNRCKENRHHHNGTRRSEYCEQDYAEPSSSTLRRRKINATEYRGHQNVHPHSDPIRRQSKRKMEMKENEPPMEAQPQTLNRNQAASLKDIYKVLKNVLDTNQKTQSTGRGFDIKELQSTIASLQTEQAQFRNIIQQQQTCLNDYHTRCIKAQHIMQTQQREIEKLNNNNQHLECEINNGIDKLRVRIDTKLKDVAHLPQMMRDEQTKSDKMSKENKMLADRLLKLQNEAADLKLRIEELGRRKAMTLTRLKATERDLKIFKNYNTALKHEKRKLSDELQKMKEQLDAVQNQNKRTLARQREQSEKQRRDLQKRVFELELRLSRSQNSTTSLIQERDSLIAELQTQLNTLVHNFEVSQKHIRVLRRHIYQMTGGNNRNGSRLLNEAN